MGRPEVVTAGMAPGFVGHVEVPLPLKRRSNETSSDPREGSGGLASGRRVYCLFCIKFDYLVMDLSPDLKAASYLCPPCPNAEEDVVLCNPTALVTILRLKYFYRVG